VIGNAHKTWPNHWTVLYQHIQLDQISKCRHGWGVTIETLSFLFWLASEASYSVVSSVYKASFLHKNQGVTAVVEEHNGVED